MSSSSSPWPLKICLVRAYDKSSSERDRRLRRGQRTIPINNGTASLDGDAFEHAASGCAKGGHAPIFLCSLGRKVSHHAVDSDACKRERQECLSC
jgi:hypothetical protein